MAILNEYNQIIREHFDISDAKTRKVIVALEDTEQTQLLSALSSALYDKIVQKVDQIDFGSIPRSRGDITKVEGFDNTVECLNIMRRLVMEYHENPDIVDTVLTSIDNIKTRKSVFMKAYALNIEFPMVLYNLIVMAIEQCVSFLIATCIQYIKDPASQTLTSALDKVAYKHSRDNLLYEQLVDFNKSCLNKDLDNIINEIIKKGKIREECDMNTCPSSEYHTPFQKFDNEAPAAGNTDSYAPGEVPVNGSNDMNCKSDDTVNEFGVLGVTAVAGAIAAGAVITLKGGRYLLKVIIPLIRNITYFCINTRVKFSDCMAVQAQLIEQNAYKLMYSTTSNLDEDKKRKVIDKQLKWAERLKGWSNKFAIDNKNAEKHAKQMVADDASKKTIDDIKDQLPPDIADKGGLFSY